jgi:hypothetical protein
MTRIVILLHDGETRALRLGAGRRARRWRLELIRCRARESADCEAEARDAKCRLALLPTWSTDPVRRKLASIVSDRNYIVISIIYEFAVLF